MVCMDYDLEFVNIQPTLPAAIDLDSLENEHPLEELIVDNVSNRQTTEKIDEIINNNSYLIDVLKEINQSAERDDNLDSAIKLNTKLKSLVACFHLMDNTGPEEKSKKRKIDKQVRY